MLVSLHIENYVLVDSLDIGFSEGLNIVSGPTGAGKSLVIGALGLLFGRRADSSVIRAGADSCVVEGEFDSPGDDIHNFCEQNDIEYDGGRFVLRRVISSSGRSRSFVNDSPVNLSIADGLGHFLVDIHSQHDTALLSSRQYQLAVIDSFADNSALLAQCRDCYGRLKSLEAEIAELNERMERARGESEYAAAMLKQLEEASIRDGEIRELEEEQFSLVHSEQIKELLQSSSSLFEGNADDGGGISSAMLSLRRNLEKLSAMVSGYSEMAGRVESCRIELKDIEDELASRNASASCSPERLQWVEERLSTLYSLLGRHGVSTEAGLVAKREEFRNLSCGPDAMSERLEEMTAEQKTLTECYGRLSDDLRRRREAAIPRFEQSIIENLSSLELENAVFRVELSDVSAGPSGRDSIVFLFSANGTSPVPVSKCASGGELSRIMLSLKELMSEFMNLPVVVLDEIDTGVSGSTADRIGALISKMGRRMQVFAITHLPQVAARADVHYIVEKSLDSSGASSQMRRLSDREHLLEVARMLSGSSLSDEAVANAGSLIAACKNK